jgi:hypothetical protein
MFSGPFAYLKHHLSESIQDAFFDAQDAKKWLRMAFRNLETSLHLLHQSRFLGRPECRLWVLRPFAYLKHQSSYFAQVAFFDCQNAETQFAWPSYTLKHRFIDINKVTFKTLGR